MKKAGNGAFGFVFEAYDQNNNRKVAIKRTHKVGNLISREFENLKTLHGQDNLVQLLELFYTTDLKGRIIQNAIFEYCDRSLEEELDELAKTETSMPIEIVKRFTKQILNGLKNMHKLGVVHRDLKPANILVMEGVAKICDFGSSKLFDKSNKMNTPFIVSRYYRAPELLLASTQYNETIDIWAVGCILFELMTRILLFPAKEEGLMLAEFAAVLGSPTLEDYRELNKIVEESNLSLLMRFGKTEKQSFQEILSYTEYQSSDVKLCADLLDRMLNWAPSKRISAADALEHPFLKDSQI